MSKNPKVEPPATRHFVLSYPAPYVLLITINRETAMNSLPSEAHWEGDALFRWFDQEPTMRIAIVTGAGRKAFCAGQDLIEQNGNQTSPVDQVRLSHPPSGFMGLSQRAGKKPVLAAVNGYALGGGFELCLNCDMVVASPTAQFGLPEPKVGLYASTGGLPRIVRNCGLQLASEIAMTCRPLSAQEALQLRLINSISKTPESVVEECVALATHIASLSPDAIIVTRQGLREAWESSSVKGAATRTADQYRDQLRAGENFRIGVEAFARKTRPQWVPSMI